MNVLIILHIFVTLALIGSILLQKGETGGLMASSQGSMFTARGSANFLTKITATLVALFIGNCILMTIVASYSVKKSDAVMKAMVETQQTQPQAKPMAKAEMPAQKKGKK